MKARQRLAHTDVRLLDHGSWPKVDEKSLKPEDRTRYVNRRNALIDYIGGTPMKTVAARYRVSRQELRRLFRRCTKPHPDGLLWGFRALLPHCRQQGYRRISISRRRRHAKACAGLFQNLLERFPDIKQRVTDLFLKKTEHIKVHDARIPLKSLHKRFLDLLREAGVRRDEYPFTEKYSGYRSVGRFLKKLHHENLARAVRVRDNADGGKLLKNGVVPKPSEAPPYALQRVMADGHRLDAIFAIELQTPTGETVVVELDRLWIFVIMDMASRAILGYHLSLNREYTDEDVLLAVQHALLPWQPRELTIPGLEYPADGGLPGGLIPDLAYATWAEIALDNANANLSDLARDRLTEVVGCMVNAGPVAMPERRAFIERLFGTLERNGFQRLPSTTGANPDDPRRRNPEKAAVRFEIMLTDMEQLLDVLIADYNGSPHSGLFGRSPLGYLASYAKSESAVITRLPEDRRRDPGLLTLRVTCTVRGNPQAGRRPHITYAGVTYRNEVLGRSPDLIGKKIVLHVNVTDLRSVRAFLPSGAELGMLTAQGYWGVTPHDLRMRKAIQSLRSRGLLRYFEGEDPIHAYLDYMEVKARKCRKSRGTLVKVKRKVDPNSRGKTETDQKPATEIPPAPPATPPGKDSPPPPPAASAAPGPARRPQKVFTF